MESKKLKVGSGKWRVIFSSLINKMTVEINKQGFNVDDNIVQVAIQQTLQELQNLGKLVPGQEVQISVVVVGRKEIKELNKKWRNKDEETDVLSFCYEKSAEKLEGEVVLCLEVIADNAKEDGIEMKKELRKNVIHSVLHIIGYEHGEEMFGLQKRILDEE